MEVLSSEKYREKTLNAAEKLEECGGRLDEDERCRLEILAARGETHRKVEAVTGGKCRVFNVETSSEKKMAGFYDGNVHLNDGTLDDYKFALHVKRHEDMHHKAMKSVDLLNVLNTAQIRKLGEAASVPGLENINLLEGFTELVTAKKYGADKKCAYTQNEVPVAQKLEDYVAGITGESLAGYFAGNRTDLFYYLVQKAVAATSCGARFERGAGHTRGAKHTRADAKKLN